MQNHNNSNNTSLIIRAMEALGALADQVVLLGGCSTELLLTDPGAPPPRTSFDIDVIIQVGSQKEYYDFTTQLLAKGFRQDKSPQAPICRWISQNGVTLDVMPTDEDILGFSNYWYKKALETAQWLHFSNSSGKQIRTRVVSPPYFLATKLEAFDGRGRGDYQASHDMEDIVALIDGRPEICLEVEESALDLRHYLRKRFKKLLETKKFTESLAGHLPGDSANQSRLPLLLKRLERLSGKLDQFLSKK